MLSFKKQMMQDLKEVFHNEDEFADKVVVEYRGQKFNIPIITDSEGAKDRIKPSGDHSEGIFVAHLTVYIAYHHLKILPLMGDRITIDRTAYKIVRVGYDAGEITLDLELMTQ